MPIALTEEQKNSPLYKYYELPIAPVPEERIASIMQMEADQSCIVPCNHLNLLFEADDYADEYGIFRCPDGGIMLSNITDMPGVTPQMFDWWFAWHGLDTMRYIIWDKDDHYYAQTRNPEKARDTTLSMKERYWNTVHDVQEALLDGEEPIPVVIPFVPPEALGFAPEKLAEFHGTIVCTSGPVIMIHFLQPAENGSKLRTRFYLGYQCSGQGNVRIPDFQAPLGLARAMLVHNIKEYTHLGKILPALYHEFQNDF